VSRRLLVTVVVVLLALVALAFLLGNVGGGHGLTRLFHG
jgi:hypothetical protein